jgi:hypothetical protein
MSKVIGPLAGGAAAMLVLAGMLPDSGVSIEIPRFKSHIPKSSQRVLTGDPTPASVERKVRRTRLRLQAVVAGGFIIEFVPREHRGLQNSTRGERRRAKLGLS